MQAWVISCVVNVCVVCEYVVRVCVCARVCVYSESVCGVCVCVCVCVHVCV